MVTEDKVTLPVLRTAKEYSTPSPTSVRPSLLLSLIETIDLVKVMAGAGVAVTVAGDGGEVTAGPVGGVPLAVALLRIEPASMSACVAT